MSYYFTSAATTLTLDSFFAALPISKKPTSGSWMAGSEFGIAHTISADGKTETVTDLSSGKVTVYQKHDSLWDFDASAASKPESISVPDSGYFSVFENKLIFKAAHPHPFLASVNYPAAKIQSAQASGKSAAVKVLDGPQYLISPDATLSGTFTYKVADKTVYSVLYDGFVLASYSDGPVAGKCLDVAGLTLTGNITSAAGVLSYPAGTEYLQVQGYGICKVDSRKLSPALTIPGKATAVTATAVPGVSFVSITGVSGAPNLATPSGPYCDSKGIILAEQVISSGGQIYAFNSYGMCSSVSLSLGLVPYFYRYGSHSRAAFIDEAQQSEYPSGTALYARNIGTPFVARVNMADKKLKEYILVDDQAAKIAAILVVSKTLSVPADNSDIKLATIAALADGRYNGFSVTDFSIRHHIQTWVVILFLIILIAVIVGAVYLVHHHRHKISAAISTQIA
jgi:hypothetical protein